MRDDAVTESISHFIGFFSLADESARMRLDYERFKAQKSAEEEQARLEAQSESRDAPLTPKDYDPKLSFKPTPEDAPSKAAPAKLAQMPDIQAQVLSVSLPLQFTPVTPPPLMAPAGSMTFVLSPPSSMAAVVVQQNTLSDNDVIGGTSAQGLLARAESEAAMTAMEALAETLTPIHLGLETVDGDWTEITETIVQATTALSAAVQSLEGAVTTVAEGGEVTTTVDFGPGTLEMTFASAEAAQGVHLDGVLVEELPEWQDYLPQFLKEDEGETTAEEDDDTGAPGTDEETELAAGDGDGSLTGGEATDGVAETGEGAVGVEETEDETDGDPVDAADLSHDFSQDFQDGNPGVDPDYEPGHDLVTGGNQLVNEAAIYSTWLDAKVFVVGGDSIKLDAISQTNVLVETDSLTKTIGGTSVTTKVNEAGGGSASQSHNIAKIETISRKEYDQQKAEEAAAKAAEEADALSVEEDTAPSDTNTDAVDSDAPTTEVDDTLAAEPETTDDTVAASEDTAAGDEPEEEAVVEYTGYPSNWAVTTIEGDLIQTNWTQQTNFVSDSDTVSFTATGHSFSIGTGENLTLNDFFAWELGFQFDLIIIGGNMIDVTVIKQMNILLDSDSLTIGVPVVESEVTGAAEETDAAEVGAAIEHTDTAIEADDDAPEDVTEPVVDVTVQTVVADSSEDDTAEVVEEVDEASASDDTAAAGEDGDSAADAVVTQVTAEASESVEADGEDGTSDVVSETASIEVHVDEDVSDSSDAGDAASEVVAQTVNVEASEDSASTPGEDGESEAVVIASEEVAEASESATSDGEDGSSAQASETSSVHVKSDVSSDQSSDDGASAESVVVAVSQSETSDSSASEPGAEGASVATEEVEDSTVDVVDTEVSDGEDGTGETQSVSVVAEAEDNAEPTPDLAASEPEVAVENTPAPAQPQKSAEGAAVAATGAAVVATELAEDEAGADVAREDEAGEVDQIIDAAIATLAAAQDDAPGEDLGDYEEIIDAAAETLTTLGATAEEDTAGEDTGDTDLALSDPEPAAPALPDPEVMKAQMADNLLVNQAEIVTIGEDIQTEMTDAYAATLDSLQNDKQVISDEILQQKEFMGTEMLRVLHIKNDFKTVNVVQQTNILGDDDQVQLAIDEFAAGLEEEMQVTMGSNALANLALVKDTGLDSTVMTQGEVYSDALLHQAELVMPEMPDMPDMSAMKASLATEAVAFLSDDMMTKPNMETMKADMAAQMEMSLPNADIMQTMLA
ncbi:hypothetical protein [Pseudooceanicola onchidii]|uniref:hypothetical protein n=1 Tax=Pseudooceanicola onchidii TaxID=2562279 RepID=UPI0010AAC76E|nr:hypothetical protein [Pseudooceanicola onchidii]